jgi:beta-fructofuranosidase
LEGDQAGADRWRPRYHVTADRNWLNDPNGPIQLDGTYHLFYQANPAAPSWGRMEWGHVSSADLVNWTRHPTALSPTPGGPDEGGCWSGCARVVDGHPALYYTGVSGVDDDRAESVCRAWGSDDLTYWVKDPANPLIPGPPPELHSQLHRDPFVWRDGDGWHLLVASGTSTGERHGRVLRYDSDDATSWRYAGIFFEAPRWHGGLDLGTQWECPQLVLEGGSAVLLVSCLTDGREQPLMHTAWFAGSILDGRLEGAVGGVVDHGDSLYAAAVCRDEAGRVLLWGWAQDPVGPDQTRSHVGALSLPRHLTVVQGRPQFRLAEGLERLRAEPLLPTATEPEHAFPARAQMELVAVFGGPDGQACWSIGEEHGEGVHAHADLTAGRVEVTVTDAAGRKRLSAADLPAHREHSLRVFVDGSLIEVFVDGESAITTRAYPAAGAFEAARFGTTGAVRPWAVQAWALANDVIGVN